MTRFIKRLFWLSCLCFPGSLLAAGSTEVLLRIGGKDITKQEFEFYCKHYAAENCRKESVRNAFDDFLFQKLKSADMRRTGCDTLPTFRQYCKVMQGELLKNVMLDKEQEEHICQDLYRQSVERLSKSGWVKIEQITIRLAQNATKQEEYAARNRMDSIYTALKQGTPFAAFSSQKKEDTWVPVVELLQEFTDRITSLSKGAFSEPFFSPLGIHIVKLTDTKPCISYEEARPYLMAYLDRLGAEHPALKRDVFARWTEGVLNDNGVQMRLETEEDALLASFWDQQHREASPREATPEELERYFKQNKNQYAWELPHFKGAVVRCVNKKMASRIKKYLKKLPVGQWKEGLHKLMAADSTVNASIEVGLFQIGKNACVDRLAFKCGKLPENDKLPYTFLMGKKLKKGPEDYTDVYEVLRNDYRREQEKRLLASLMQHFGVEIKQDVLKTVNCCGSN